jgi:hypothetical protein
MPQNFLRCDRDQELLLPPNVRDWLPEGHLASFVLDTVDALDLDGFYRAYRADGHGRAAHDPASMLTLLLSGGETCTIATRVITQGSQFEWNPPSIEDGICSPPEGG